MRRWLARLSLRTTLVLAMVALVTLGLAAAGVASTAALRGYLTDEVDHRLVEASEVFSRPAPGGPGSGPPPSDSGSPGPRPPSEFVGAVLDANGTFLYPVDDRYDADEGFPEWPTWDLQEVLARDGEPANVDGGDHDWRVVAQPRSDGSGSVLLAASLRDADNTVHRLTLLNLVIGLVVLALVGLLAHLAVRRSLRPLGEVETTAAAIAAGDLSQRVPDRDARTEVGRLGRALNAMLGRIESAFRAQQASEATARASEERMRRFVADASHELRTPLTSIRGFAELYRQGAANDVPRLMGRIESESERMGRLVEDLLLLARLDEQREVTLVPVELSGLAADAVHDAQVVAPDRPIRLEAAEPVVVNGDEHQLRQMLANLVGNALHHTPAGTPVTVRVRAEGAQGLLEVADEGPGLAPDHAERIFERFYRADASRSRASGGAGLGLSIVAALAVAHGGSAEVDTAPGRGAVFRVRLPLPG